MKTLKTVLLVIFVITTIVFGILYFFNPKIIEVEKKVPAEITETEKTKIIDDHIAAQTKKALADKEAQEKQEKKDGVIYITDKTYPIPQGLYEVKGWLLTPAGKHIAHGNPVYVQFNYLTTAAISPCGAKLKPVKTVPTGVVVIEIGTKPIVVAQADTSTPAPAPTPAPKPTPAPVPATDPFKYYAPNKRETAITIKAGYKISGDVWIRSSKTGNIWVKCYDEFPEVSGPRSAETSSIIVLSVDTEVYGFWGFSTADKTITESEMEQRDLAKGFLSKNILWWRF